MLRESVSQYFRTFQRNLFPGFLQDLGKTTDRHIEVIVALDMIQIEKYTPYKGFNAVGRPMADRDALARSFISKALLNIPTTLALIDRLRVDSVLRRICGFHGKLPCEATFSNAFSEFADLDLMGRAHEALVCEVYQDRIVGHVSRDSTMIDAREKPLKKSVEEKKDEPVRPRGRPKKNEARVEKDPTRLENQIKSKNVTEILQELPKSCDVGGKKNSNGNHEWTIGYKMHFDVDDNGIPLSAILTSASMHDSQAAIPLELITNSRVKSLYSVMDAAYNSPLIIQVVTDAGKVPIIDPKKPRGGEKIPLDPAKKERFKIRTSVERTNSSFKDSYGGRFIQVKGHTKVYAHLMFGVVAMTALKIVEHLV